MQQDRVSGRVTHLPFDHSKIFVGRSMTPTREHKTHIKYILGKTHHPLDIV